MNVLRIEVNLINPDLQAIDHAIHMLGNVRKYAEKTATAESEDEAPTPKKSKKSEANETAKAAVAKKTATPESEDEAPEPKKEKVVSLEDLRALLSYKVAEHREAIKAALKKTGAENLTTLPVEHRNEFYKFLQTLENE